MGSIAEKRLRLSGGTELAFMTAGDKSNPALLLLHGYASSSRTFRDVIPALSRGAYVIAPDLPGYGDSDPLPTPSFAALGDAVTELLRHLEIGKRFIYLHDWGAPVGLHIAMQSPDLVSGLIIQNANAHHTGFAPQWEDTFQYWREPTAENKAKATSFLTFEDTRAQYTRDVPPDDRRQNQRRTLGRGLAGVEPAWPLGDAAPPPCRLWQVRRPLRRDRARISKSGNRPP